MPQADSMQWSFAGGEWAPEYQGRVDDDLYNSGLNVSMNGYPIQTGAWTRRQGTRWAGFTRSGAPAKVLPFAFARRHGIVMRELRDGVAHCVLRPNANPAAVAETRRLLRLPEFRTRAARMGKVVHLGDDHVRWWQLGDDSEYAVHWGRPSSRRTGR